MLHDQPTVTKGAQGGTTWEDHAQLTHSGFGPFCNPIAIGVYPNANESLDFFLLHGHGTPMQWFEQRAACLEGYCEAIRKRSPHVAFCVCCTYTTADTLYNALYWLQVADDEEDELPAQHDDRDSTFRKVEQALVPYLTPRRRQGYWFPRVAFFGRKGHAHDLRYPDEVEIDFQPTSKLSPRVLPARFATLALQAAGAANYPDGVRTTTLGSTAFTPAMFGSHDIKRGAIMCLSTGGAADRSGRTSNITHSIDIATARIRSDRTLI